MNELDKKNLEAISVKIAPSNSNIFIANIPIMKNIRELDSIISESRLSWLVHIKYVVPYVMFKKASKIVPAKSMRQSVSSSLFEAKITVDSCCGKTKTNRLSNNPVDIIIH